MLVLVYLVSMAKRTTKTETSTKQTAATRRTKKEATPVKKAPVKKTATEKPKTATSGNVIKTKTPKKVVKTEVKTPIRQHLATSDNEKTKKTRAVRNKPSEFVRLAANAKREDFTEMGERVRQGEVQWVYYIIDEDVSYHYYKILK